MLLSLSNISFEFGGRYLYKDVSWQINAGEKIGLIGANGTGKSTLLRVITGQYQVESGTINKLRNLSIGFLNQDLLSYNTQESILHVAMQAFEEALQVQDKINELLLKIETDHSEEVLHQLHDLQLKFDHLDGYNLQHKAEALLEGLGFATADLNRPMNQFSGGWRMRVMLAKIILQEPDILLLDEPTNHLDLPSIKWIEEYLSNYAGTIIIVSHDRYFLDNIVTSIVEVNHQRLYHYKGNYTDFLEQKAERDSLQQSRFDNQQKYIKEQQQLIDRFKAKASKAKMAQSRMKMLERMDRVDEVASDAAAAKFKFNIGTQPGRTLKDLAIQNKSYAQQQILNNTQCKVLRGDKIALIGANGKGKSTLLRMLHQSEPFIGQYIDGHNVNTSFYAQHQLESLDLNLDPLEELIRFAPDRTDGEIRKILGSFLFSGDDVYKKIKVLSGGEKSRVALAKLVLSNANFLLLDEPTNHLDMKTVNTLIDILNDYEGSFVVVSHDRYFFSEIANKIWYIEDEQIKEYPGSYHEFEEARAEALARQNTIKKEQKTQRESKDKKNTTEPKNQKAAIQKKLDHTEAQLKQTKLAIAQQELAMAQPQIFNDKSQLQAAVTQVQQLKETQITLQAQWDQLFDDFANMTD